MLLTVADLGTQGWDMDVWVIAGIALVSFALGGAVSWWAAQRVASQRLAALRQRHDKERNAALQAAASLKAQLTQLQATLKQRDRGPAVAPAVPVPPRVAETPAMNEPFVGRRSPRGFEDTQILGPDRSGLRD